MEYVGKMCTPCRRERQFEPAIRLNPIHPVSRHLQEHVNARVDHAPSEPAYSSVRETEPSKRRNTLHKRKRYGDQAMNASNQQQVERDEGDAETTLNAHDAARALSSTHPLTNEHEIDKKPTWLRNWFGKLRISTSNNPSPQTPNSAYLPRIFSLRQTQKTDHSDNSSKSRRSDAQRAHSRSLSRIFCFHGRQKSHSPSITASNGTRPNTPNTPQAAPRITVPSPRASSLDIPRETKESTTNQKRKRRSLNVHWRNSIPSTSECLLDNDDQHQQPHESRRNKRSSRRDSAGIWTEIATSGGGGENNDNDDWYDPNDPDRLLLENWSLHHRALVEDWQGN